MSEKRFIVDEDSYLLDTENKIIFGYNVNSYLVDLLNSLSEENKRLQQQLDKIPPRIKEIWLNG